MSNENYVVQSKTPFAKSLIWQLNRDYYQNAGINAWSEGVVPHQMTSNAKVGLTYAELIFAFLKDVAVKYGIEEKVYILELGAGHGRLAFHILKQLDKLIQSFETQLPAYCYVLSDIVESNLSFFQNHPQLQSYLKDGKLDVAYFDAIGSNNLVLRKANFTIETNSLNVPIAAIANYFFDSIPNDLYYIKDGVMSMCSVSIDSRERPENEYTIDMMKDMKLIYHYDEVMTPPYQPSEYNEILEKYRTLTKHTYLFYPNNSFQCIDNIKALSSEGLLLLSMDKGVHDAQGLDQKPKPDIISHGSFSLWVNFHALDSYCKKLGGQSHFSSFSNFHLEIGCMLFLSNGDSYSNTESAYTRVVDEFGPDDFNTIKRMVYANVASMSLKELIAVFRLSAYDSTIFTNLFPKVRHLSQQITHKERDRLVQTIDRVWDMYFHINESFDLAYESGGLLYDLGHYTKALLKFQQSLVLSGDKADVYYNIALCHYQLRQDALFYDALNKGKNIFPESQLFDKLLELDMG